MSDGMPRSCRRGLLAAAGGLVAAAGVGVAARAEAGPGPPGATEAFVLNCRRDAATGPVSGGLGRLVSRMAGARTIYWVVLALSSALPISAQSRRLKLLYAEDKAACSAIYTYLQRIDNRYPRKTRREAILLQDPFIERYLPLLPKDLSVPVPSESENFGTPPDGVPHYALYSVVLNPSTGVQQLITINDSPLGSDGVVMSSLYLFNPGVAPSSVFTNSVPPPTDVLNSIPTARGYRTIPSPYFLEKLYTDADRKKSTDWRISHDLFLSSPLVLRLFVWTDHYFVLAGYPLLDGVSVVFKVAPTGNFADTCYYRYSEYSRN
jgi:hypothetical protein